MLDFIEQYQLTPVWEWVQVEFDLSQYFTLQRIHLSCGYSHQLPPISIIIMIIIVHFGS